MLRKITFYASKLINKQLLKFPPNLLKIDSLNDFFWQLSNSGQKSTLPLYTVWNDSSWQNTPHPHAGAHTNTPCQLGLIVPVNLWKIVSRQVDLKMCFSQIRNWLGANTYMDRLFKNKIKWTFHISFKF